MKNIHKIMSEIDFECLLLLSKAKCESNVKLILSKYTDIESKAISLPKHMINDLKQLLNDCVNDLAVIQLITNISKLVYISLKTDLSDDSINGLFPKSFDHKLKAIIIESIHENSDKWLANVKPIQSMPSLVDFECRTDANNCVLDLTLSDRKSDVFKQSLLLSKQQIQDLTKGLAAVRQQLFEATNKSN